jgi:ubiquinone/menaquinone biosynthesis C-methylase UbiE
MADRAFAGDEFSAVRWHANLPEWWDEHWGDAVDEVIEFLRPEGIEVSGSEVLDLGCGDGIISLGLLRRAGAARVMGCDLFEVDRPFLAEKCIEHGEPPISESEAISFVVSDPTRLPFDDNSFDVVTAWSVFEHVLDPRPLLREVVRVLRPEGVVFLQIWPLWNSEHGSHLWTWFDQPFQHLMLNKDEVREHLEEKIPDEDLASAMFDLYRSCNKISIDELQMAMIDAGLFLCKVDVVSSSFHVPRDLQRIPLSKLSPAGIKIMAKRLN